MANDILVKIGADITDFSRKMAESNKALSNFGKANKDTFGAFKKVGGALTKSITAPALAATTALTGITLVKGFQRLVGIDTARAKLSALGHDAGSVEEIMNNALDSVRGTSFGMDEAATAAASAVAAGIEPGKELTKYLSTMGDAAAIAGTDFNDMASIFNKVQTAQRAYTGDLNQLADRGIPIYQWLAEEAGTSAEAIREMASKGEVSSEMFRTAIEKNIGGAAKEIGEKSFMAALKNIGADIGRIGANFLDAGGKGEGFFSRIKPLLTEFRGFLQSLEEPAAELGKKFGDMFIKVVEGIKTAVGWFTQLSPMMQKIVVGFTAFASISAVAAGPLLRLIGFIPQLIAGFTAIVTVVKTVIGIFGMLAGAISSPVAIIVAAVAGLALVIYKNWDEIKAFMEATWDAIVEAAIAVWDWMKDVWNSAVEAFVEIFAPLIEIMSEVWENIKVAAEAAWELIKNVVLGPVLLLIDLVTGNFDEMGSHLSQIWKNISGAAETIWSSLIDIFSLVWNAIKRVFDNALQWLDNKTGGKFSDIIKVVSEYMDMAFGIIEDIWGFIKRSFSNALEFVKGLVTLDFGRMWNAIKDQMGNISETISSVWNRIKSFFSGKLSEILSNLKRKFTEMVSAVRGKMSEIRDKIEEMMKKAIDYLKGINLMQVGKDIIQGLINGIGSMAKAVWKKAKDIATGIGDSIKKTLDIRSPSRVLMEIGKWTSIGLAEGIEDYAYLVDKASDKLAESAIPDIDNIDMSYATPGGAMARSLAGAVSGTVDVRHGEEALVRAIASLERRLIGLEVTLDGRTVGRLVEPYVTENQGRKDSIRRSFRG